MAKEINSDLLRGNIDTIILKVLYSGDRYGYDIVSEVEQKSHGQLTIKQPTLYSCLKRLESQNLITSYWGEQSNGGRRKYYSLTESGKEMFKQSQDDYEYSRTVMDKLISEDRYNLGGDQNIHTTADTHIEDADQSVASTLLENSAENSQYEQNDEVQQPIDVMSQVGTEASLTDNIACEGNDADLTTEIEKDAEKAAEQPLYDAGSENISDSMLVDAGLFREHSVESYDDEMALKQDNEVELRDIFGQNSENHSYLSDLKSSDMKGDGAVSDNTFYGNFSDLLENGSSAPKMQYEPQYADDEYPYADSSDYGSSKIEAELTPKTEPEKSKFASYHDEAVVQSALRETELQIAESHSPSNEYQDRLSMLIDRFNDDSNEITKTDIENNALALNNKVEVRTFGNIVESARELGEEVVVRETNNQSKHQYASKYYFHDNQMRLFVNGIVFVLMLLESFILYTVFKNGMGANGKYDVAIYVLSVVCALSLPLYAGFKFYNDPYGKKRIETRFGDAIVFRIVIMMLISLLAFGVSLFMGLQLSGKNISQYLVVLFLPMILSTNFPISGMIYRFALRRGIFAVKD